MPHSWPRGYSRCGERASMIAQRWLPGGTDENSGKIMDARPVLLPVIGAGNALSGVHGMIGGQLSRHLRRPFPADEGNDRQLLERFVDEGEEAAFETLVRRHGPMVLGVCRRILNDPNDADDAFQATFL